MKELKKKQQQKLYDIDKMTRFTETPVNLDLKSEKYLLKNVIVT